MQVHLLNDERGPVIETLIARTQRQVIASAIVLECMSCMTALPLPASPTAPNLQCSEFCIFMLVMPVCKLLSPSVEAPESCERNPVQACTSLFLPAKESDAAILFYMLVCDDTTSM